MQGGGSPSPKGSGATPLPLFKCSILFKLMIPPLI